MGERILAVLLYVILTGLLLASAAVGFVIYDFFKGALR